MKRATWKRQLQERPDRPQGRQRRQLDALLALADQLDAETGEGAVPLLEVVKAAGVSERTARRAIGWATTSGLLQRTRRGHRLGDGMTTSSGWRLLGKPESQPANSRPEPANPSPQPASSQSQPANPPKLPGTAAARSKRKATKEEIAKFREWVAKQPRCPDGMPGGDQPGPDGVALCPFCDGRAERT